MRVRMCVSEREREREGERERERGREGGMEREREGGRETDEQGRARQEIPRQHSRTKITEKKSSVGNIVYALC